MKERYPIQIAATTASATILYALCNDGTIWKMPHDRYGGDEWKEVNEIPQPRKRS